MSVKPAHYLGIDPGLKNLGLGITSIDHNTGLVNFVSCCGFTTSTNLAIGERLLYLKENLAEIIKSVNPAGVACESPAFGARSAAYSLGAVHGLVALLCHEYQLPLVKIAPMQLRKFFKTAETIKEKDKNIVRTGVSNFLNTDLSKIKKTDPIDALGISVVGNCFFNLENSEKVEDLTRNQLEVLRAISLYTNF